jgi:hypothetical protein
MLDEGKWTKCISIKNQANASVNPNRSSRNPSRSDQHGTRSSSILHYVFGTCNILLTFLIIGFALWSLWLGDTVTWTKIAKSVLILLVGLR